MAVTIPSRQVTVGGWTFTVFLHERRPGARGETTTRPTLSTQRALRCTISPALRWWLDADHVASVMAALRSDRAARRLGLADLIEWVLATGLSLEESLRVTWLDVARCGQEGRTVHVSGRGAVPLSDVAAAVLDRRRGLHALWVFKVTPGELAAAWRRVRRSLGLADTGAADLRALRRKASVRRAAFQSPASDIVEHLEREGISAAAGSVRLIEGRVPLSF